MKSNDSIFSACNNDLIRKVSFRFKSNIDYEKIVRKTASR